MVRYYLHQFTTYCGYTCVYSYNYSLYIAFLRLWETAAAARTRSLARGHGRLL